MSSASLELEEIIDNCFSNRIAAFDAFTEGNNPHGEHDFGTVSLGLERYFWKIDYYDSSLQLGSPDPADPAVTVRVLTIMRADEY